MKRLRAEIEAGQVSILQIFLPKMLNKLFYGWVITMIIDYIQASLASLEAGHSDHHLLTATIKSYLR